VIDGVRLPPEFVEVVAVEEVGVRAVDEAEPIAAGTLLLLDERPKRLS